MNSLNSTLSRLMWINKLSLGLSRIWTCSNHISVQIFQNLDRSILARQHDDIVIEHVDVRFIDFALANKRSFWTIYHVNKFNYLLWLKLKTMKLLGRVLHYCLVYLLSNLIVSNHRVLVLSDYISALLNVLDCDLIVVAIIWMLE